MSERRAWRGRGARRARLLPGLALALLPAAGPPPQETRPPAEPAPAEPPAPSVGAGAPAAGPRYHGPEEARERLSGWLASGNAEALELGRTAGGRELLALQLGGVGGTPLAERTTVLLVGGLDGVSLAGSEAVLATVDRLLAAPQDLPPDVAFVAVPWANPDGLARWLATGWGGGRNDRPTDDDGDGALDEDPPDDLDGDGVVVEMLVEDPAGPWARAEGGRFLRPAHAGDGKRYRREREGRDDDGDGLYNEDGPGGVVLDRSFPLGWPGPWTGLACGPRPLSEPAAEALARLALARRTALVVCFQGNHGGLAVPGGLSPEDLGLALPFPADEASFAWITESFVRHTGRAQAGPLRLEELRGPSPGAALDWFYAALGALACEVGVWGPEVQRPPAPTVPVGPAGSPGSSGSSGSGGDPREGAAAREGSFGPRAWAEAERLGRADRAWARWLDELRGGIGFVDWQPVDLGGGREGWVGGWEPQTRTNPPVEVLPRALEGLPAFVLELARGLPRPQVEVRETARRGRVAYLRVRVANPSPLPTGVGPALAARFHPADRAAGAAGADPGAPTDPAADPTGPAGPAARADRSRGDPGAGPTIRLHVPEGASLVAGEAVLVLEPLPARGTSREVEWLILAPEETPVRIELEFPWAPPQVREVRL